MPSRHSFIVKLMVSLAVAGSLAAAEKSPTPGAKSVGQGSTVSASVLLTSGVPASFSLPAVDDFTLFNGDSGFRVVVPSGATALHVQLETTTPDVDVDLYVRRGS